MNSVTDGAEAISFLRHQGKYASAPAPDLVVLDLNLPRRDGRQVLSDMKTDPALAKIPVVIFTTSQASSDISRSYELGANCYSEKAGKPGGVCRRGAIDGGVLAGLRDFAQEGETMNGNGQATHVLLIEDNPGDADLVRLRLVQGTSGHDVSCVHRLSDGLASIKEALLR